MVLAGARLRVTPLWLRSARTAAPDPLVRRVSPARKEKRGRRVRLVPMGYRALTDLRASGVRLARRGRKGSRVSRGHPRQQSD